jgi:predicted dithiol-disulfide oxidoreductase (DUF899 family)
MRCRIYKGMPFETYWTTRRGGEALDRSYALMDLTVYGRQELWGTAAGHCCLAAWLSERKPPRCP